MARGFQSAIPLTIKGVTEARADFVDGEPRNLFYVVASELIELISKETPGSTRISVAQALAVLLQTWNKSFYQYRGGFHESDLSSLEALLRNHSSALKTYRGRQITSLAPGEEETVRVLFGSFAKDLGGVGAAKCLHLLAPTFFPLWDRAIAKAYRVNVNPDGYIEFMRISRDQCRSLVEQSAPWSDLLKAIDEYNYWHYTVKPRREKAQQKGS